MVEKAPKVLERIVLAKTAESQDMIEETALAKEEELTVRIQLPQQLEKALAKARENMTK